MVDFDSLRSKAEAFIDKNEEKIDDGIDKAADAAGKKFGHGDQLDKAADKLKGMTGDNKE
jgi:hypothetical protein